jgi:hypothetical protein
MIDALGFWLAETRLSFFVNSSPAIWAGLETLHFFGLAVLIGAVGFLDLRLLGFFRGVPVAPLRSLFPWMVGAFLLNLTTGVMFLAASPFQYIHNSAFGLKLLFIAIAGANAGVYGMTLSRGAALIGPGMDTPPALKVCGAVSLFAWLAVIYFGRMIPYFGG